MCRYDEYRIHDRAVAVDCIRLYRCSYKLMYDIRNVEIIHLLLRFLSSLDGSNKSFKMQKIIGDFYSKDGSLTERDHMLQFNVRGSACNHHW